MSSKVSFEGIGQIIATFYAEEGVKAGEVVKVSGSAAVAPCGAGEGFCGAATSVAEGCAGVAVKGMVEVPCGDAAVTAGYATLTADGAGGVKKAGEGDAGREYLVVSAENGTAIILM